MTSSPDGASAVRLHGVAFARRGRQILEGVDLEVPPRELLAIVGPNGSGKTTLLQLVLGLLEPGAGEVQVLGTTPRDARGRVGYVPQHHRFDVDFPIRVLDVALMGRLAAGAFRRFTKTDREKAREALAQVEMADLAHRPIGALSGGQLQRVLIARALAVEPDLLLLDEPTSSLDEWMEKALWGQLQELSRDVAVIVVTHELGTVSTYVDRVACLNRRLHVHESKKLTPELLESVYGKNVDLLDHGHAPHGGD